MARSRVQMLIKAVLIGEGQLLSTSAVFPSGKAIAGLDIEPDFTS